MAEKRKIQELNRIPIPTAMLNSLNLKVGDDIHLACDEDRIYLAKRQDKLPRMMALFNSGQGTSSTGLVAASSIPKIVHRAAVNYTDLEQGKTLTQKTIILCLCGKEIVLEEGHLVDQRGAPLCPTCSARILGSTFKVLKSGTYCGNKLKKGDIVYRYMGAAYGCISQDGIAVTKKEDTGPFFEVPVNSLGVIK